ncbi:O-antigen ligase family protein [Staphylococcus aureus]|uniref:O-antigen ligase family protein n=1 Tax=Staphylococcus aureus TaxID=1280 RepID=UPI0030102291
MENQYNSKLLTLLLIGLAVFIQQSSVIAGVNLSIADFITLLILVYLLFFANHLLKANHFLQFFIILYTYRMIITLCLLFFDDLIFITVKEVLASTVKYAFVVIYFYLGMIIFKLGNSKKVIVTSYIISSVTIGLFCIIAGLNKSPLLMKLLYFDEIRSKGLMNDPNYFAMTQIITLVLAYKYIHNYIFKVLACGILLWSLTTTGSKTAFIILIVLAIYFFIKKLFSRNAVSVVSMLVIMLILLCFTFYNINYYLFQLSDLDAVPSLDRMASIFEEGFASLNDSGSERSVVWINAILVIKYTLGFGVGLVDYVHIGSQINGILLVAHNTYLQIFAEWGILFGALFIIFMLYLLFELFRFNISGKNVTAIVVMLTMLIYFLTVSFNNSRYVAFILGIIVFIVQYEKMERDRNEE